MILVRSGRHRFWRIVAASSLSVIPLFVSFPARAAWVSNGLRISPSPAIQFDAAIVPDGFGGAIIAWQDRLGTDHVTPIIRLDASGNVVSGWPTIEAQASQPWNDVTMTPDGQGGVYVGNVHEYPALAVRHVLSNGAFDPAWGAGIPLSGGFADLGFFPFLAPDGSGGIIAGWSSQRAAGTISPR